jgi:hypothetical protein
VVAVLLLTAARPSPAAARRVRPLFEPTDLELEDPGVLEADLHDVDLDASDRFSLAASVSGVHFASSESDQLLTTTGIVWSPSAWIDLSLPGLVGRLTGNDRYGLLLGVSPKFRLSH